MTIHIATENERLVLDVVLPVTRGARALPVNVADRKTCD